MEVLYDANGAMCPAEPDRLLPDGCSDGCELLTGEVCEASWWDGLLNDSEAGGPGADISEDQQADTCMVSLWSVDSGLDDSCVIPPFHTDPIDPITCIADELQHFSEQLTHSLPCPPETPAQGIQNCLSSSNVCGLSSGNCSGKVSVPVIYTAVPAVAQPAAAVDLAEADAAEPAAASPPFRGVLTIACMNHANLKGEEEDSQLSPSQQALRMKLPHSLRNAAAIRDGRCLPFPGGWRGCVKSSWCNRENRHRGVCNTRAEVPGLAAYGAEQLAAAGVRGADFPGQWPLEGIKEEQPGCEGLDDSEQASATEVLLERACDPDGQCLDSGVPRCGHIRLLPDQATPSHGCCQHRPRPRIVVKRQERPAAAAAAATGSPPGGPPTPQLQAPLFASQDSSDSADSNTQREGDASSQETGAADADEVRCSARLDRSPEPKRPDIAKTSERLRRTTPPTPDKAATPRPTSKPAQESLEKSLPQAPAAEAPASPFSSPPPGVGGRGSSLPGAGFVQTSSGRIARPTPKTAASRASSAELSELSHTEGQRAPAKRKSGRPAKGGEKGKRRRMVNGVLKTVGYAAPGQQCTQCSTQVTPVWRAGPYGPKTLCNACGVRYMKQVKKK